ncbi:PaaI family thioesterase [Ligilactobacillus sp. WILCCON 0076]|uniref:PaaI family thioesterase n=1 Tax=Ligilactobacillus ubinensis TaxID=2876789 RepID=A0A9X2FHC9_9LACO|nr:PaaI family thioesterase [Ligilactobacillus ubinensis]MCP0885860.1 PaaI family thioesterase [Ligilactobacillus ubinensis]
MNLLELLNIEIMTSTPTKVLLQMPISSKHLQPFGLVHGGLNTVLAETAASIGANLKLASSQHAVGIDVQTHHLKTVTQGQGILYVCATPLSQTHSLQVWQAYTYLTPDTKTSFSTITLKNSHQSE